VCLLPLLPPGVGPGYDGGADEAAGADYFPLGVGHVIHLSYPRTFTGLTPTFAHVHGFWKRNAPVYSGG